MITVNEQELFHFDIEYASEYNIRYSKDAREILSLLYYAPKPIVEHIKILLRKYKKTYEEGIKEY